VVLLDFLLKIYGLKCLVITSNYLIINIVLPIKYAYQRQDKKLIRRVLKIYRQIPAENNEIIRRWKIQGIEFQNALETQSCLYQYKVWQKENR